MQDEAGIGREPEDRRLVVPGKDALGVGREQALRREVAPVREQTVGVTLARIGKGEGPEFQLGHQRPGRPVHRVANPTASSGQAVAASMAASTSSTCSTACQISRWFSCMKRSLTLLSSSRKSGS